MARPPNRCIWPRVQAVRVNSAWLCDLCQRTAAITVIEAGLPKPERRRDTMLLTMLSLATGLLANAGPQAEPQREWVVELRGYTMCR
jgi:hypothetical protein